MLELKVTINPEGWDEINEVFVPSVEKTILLEHSLISISKWEAKWNKCFLSKEDKTKEEIVDYIKCMTITPNVDPMVYERLSSRNFKEINSYIEAPMTATHIFDDNRSSGNGKYVTSELIYYWMISLGIPFECQKWHINRLLMLIKVCNAENNPQKGRKGRELAQYHSALNAARRGKNKSKG